MPIRLEKDRQTGPVMADTQPQDMLGSEQWQWLADELHSNTADLTLLGSGLQVGIVLH
jgi:phosphodiesterase/alkaline phosphatase D-like protein